MKDLFLKGEMRNDNPIRYEIIRNKINRQYATQMNWENHDIEMVKNSLEGSSFKTEFVRKPLYINDQYGLYSIFQGLNDLGGDINDVFKVIDFYELKATKP